MARAGLALLLLFCTAATCLGQDAGPGPAPAAPEGEPAPPAGDGTPGHAPAPAPVADPAPPTPTPGLPSKAELAGMVLALANVQAAGASKLGLDLDVCVVDYFLFCFVFSCSERGRGGSAQGAHAWRERGGGATHRPSAHPSHFCSLSPPPPPPHTHTHAHSTCTPGTLNPSKRAPAVLQWPSARAVLVTAVCVKNGTSSAAGSSPPPCQGAITASQALPAYSLPPRWEPATFVTPACRAGLTLPFPGRVAALPFTPPGEDGGIEVPLLPPTTLECDSLAALKGLGLDWPGRRGRAAAGGCRVSGPLVDPQAAVDAALDKLAEVKGVLGLA